MVGQIEGFMEVDGHCLACNEWFNAHWHVFPDYKRKCPNCKNEDRRTLVIHIDEDFAPDIWACEEEE